MSASSSPRRDVRHAALFLALAASATLGIVLACGDATHIYEGRLFVESRGCLGTTSSVDVVSGERPGDCGPTCLVQPLADGGRSIYAATMCGPYPFMFNTTGTDPACPIALGALGRNDTCLADGDSSSPVPPPALGRDGG